MINDCLKGVGQGWLMRDVMSENREQLTMFSTVSVVRRSLCWGVGGLGWRRWEMMGCVVMGSTRALSQFKRRRRTGLTAGSQERVGVGDLFYIAQRQRHNDANSPGRGISNSAQALRNLDAFSLFFILFYFSCLTAREMRRDKARRGEANSTEAKQPKRQRKRKQWEALVILWPFLPPGSHKQQPASRKG